MKILIEDITDEGLEVEVDEEGALFEPSLKGSPFSIEEPVKGALTVRRFESLIDVSGSIRAIVRAECSRCLKSFLITVECDISSRFVKGAAKGDGGETQLRKGDMDITYLTGEELDTHEVVAEQILLELPYKPICSEGCKGLCSICGSNRNDGACKCEPHEDIDRRFAKLKGFKVK